MLGGSNPAGFIDETGFVELASQASNKDVDEQRVGVRIMDAAIMMYTSGTTANPKGCPLNHEVLVRNGINRTLQRRLLT